MCTQTERRGRELIRLSDHYISSKNKQNRHISLSSEMIKFLRGGLRIELNLDLSGFFIKQRDKEDKTKYIHLMRHSFNYLSHSRHATHIVYLSAGACVFEPRINQGCVSYQQTLLSASAWSWKPHIYCNRLASKSTHRAQVWLRMCKLTSKLLFEPQQMSLCHYPFSHLCSVIRWPSVKQ